MAIVGHGRPNLRKRLGKFATIPLDALSNTPDLVPPDLPKIAHALSLVLWIATSLWVNSNPTKAHEDETLSHPSSPRVPITIPISHPHTHTLSLVLWLAPNLSKTREADEKHQLMVSPTHYQQQWLQGLMVGGLCLPNATPCHPSFPITITSSIEVSNVMHHFHRSNANARFPRTNAKSPFLRTNAKDLFSRTHVKSLFPRTDTESPFLATARKPPFLAPLQRPL